MILLRKKKELQKLNFATLKRFIHPPQIPTPLKTSLGEIHC